MDLDRYFDEQLDEHSSVLAATREACRAPFLTLVEACAGAVRDGGKIVFFGNGGSAADAQHLATELSVRYSENRAPIAALALTTDTSALTAIGNDMGFDELFARQVDALCAAGDVAIGISTSGRSVNVVRGLERARARECTAAAFTGAGDSPVGQVAAPCLAVPSTSTARIQEMHITLGQMLCGALEAELGLVS